MPIQILSSEGPVTLQWRHNELDGVLNHRRLGCLLNRWFRRRSKKASKLRITGLCEGNSPVTGEFPAQRASNAENVFIWWRHHECGQLSQRISPSWSRKLTAAWVTWKLSHARPKPLATAAQSHRAMGFVNAFFMPKTKPLRKLQLSWESPG